MDLDNVDRGLAQYEAHFKGEKRRQLGQVMRIVCLVARHWVRVGTDHDAELWSYTKDVDVARHGMTPKNMELLMSLRDPRTMARLLGLGPKIMRKALAKSRIKKEDAIRAQVGFAATLLLNAPARICNISAIHLDKSVQRIGNGAEERILIEFPGADVKNGRDLMYELTELTKEQLGLYLNRIRPKVTRDPGNRWLFPGEGDGAKGFALLSGQIGDLTEEIVGVRITAHKFRHFVGLVHMLRSGNDTATVAKVLGIDEATARQYYVFLRSEEALKNWNETLRLKREELAPLIDGTVPKPRRRRRGKT